MKSDWQKDQEAAFVNSVLSARAAAMKRHTDAYREADRKAATDRLVQLIAQGLTQAKNSDPGALDWLDVWKWASAIVAADYKG